MASMPLPIPLSWVGDLSHVSSSDCDGGAPHCQVGDSSRLQGGLLYAGHIVELVILKAGQQVPTVAFANAEVAPGNPPLGKLNYGHPVLRCCVDACRRDWDRRISETGHHAGNGLRDGLDLAISKHGKVKAIYDARLGFVVLDDFGLYGLGFLF